MSVKLSKNDLLPLEDYHKKRKKFRQEISSYKKPRRIHIGPNASLYFESRLTMLYQVQEMVYIERMLADEAINEELNTYNPLIPDGDNWKATFMIEYEDANERKKALEALRGIEDRVWLAMNGFEKVFAIADEDLERSNETKTSAVHFLRFQFDEDIVVAIRNDAEVKIGISHPNYDYEVILADDSRKSLIEDFKIN